MTKKEMENSLAKRICPIPPGVTVDNCYDVQDRSDLPCSGHGKCRIIEKSKDQLEYVLLSPINQNVFLDACPGAGKTEVVGLKAACEMKNWNKAPGGIAVLTFTNNARDVISERVTQFAGNRGIGFPHYIGTIDSWLHGYIGQPFGYLRTQYAGDCNDRSIRLVEENLSDGWINGFKLEIGYPYGEPTQTGKCREDRRFANMIRYNVVEEQWEIKVSSQSTEYKSLVDFFNSDGFQNNYPNYSLKELELQFGARKGDFFKSGLATYQDIEDICWRVIDKKEGFSGLFAARFPLVFIDECQDLSPTQLQIIESLMEKGTNFHFVGDLNQAIHSFRSVFPQKVKKAIEEKGFTKFKLEENFRSIQSIVEVCGKIVDHKRIIGRITGEDDESCVFFFYDKKNIYSIPEHFANYLERKSIKISDACIVARGHALVNHMRPGGSVKIKLQKLLPTALRIWKANLVSSKREAIECAGKFVSERFYPHDSRNSNENYCPKSYDSKLKWRLDITRFLNTCYDLHHLVNLDLTWKEWCKEYNENIVNIIKEVGFQNLPDSQDIKRMVSPSGKGNEVVSSTLGTIISSPKSKIRISTIHNVKGETFDAVLFVSSPNNQGGKGGFWEKWLEDNKNENARFAYVASSRPKYLLAWAIPEPKDTEKDKVKGQIENLGFEFVEKN
ncbi:MAG: ATP-dependent helicase [Calditrichaeota bacterium]|nr:ATP-dependent helicase [Calditrichota bacterium]